MVKNRGGIIGLITFIFGLVFGGLATLLLSTDEKGNTKAPVRGKLKTVKAGLHELTDKEKVAEIYGKASEAGLKQYQAAKVQVVQKVDALKKNLDTIDKEKYKTLVTGVVQTLKKEGAITASQLKKMSTFLYDDYQRLIASKPNRSTKTKK